MIDREHELEDLTCPACTGTLAEMSDQVEESEEITVVERQYLLVRHRRK